MVRPKYFCDAPTQKENLKDMNLKPLNVWILSYEINWCTFCLSIITTFK